MSFIVLTQKTDYDENLSLLLEQYKNSANMIGILKATNKQANEIELAAFEIKDNFILDVAIGAQLDIIGKIRGVEREGKSDADYRSEIKKKAGTRFSGEPEIIIDILQSVYGATFIKYIPFYPGKYYIYSDADISYTDLQSISAAGVEGIVQHLIQDGVGNVFLDGAGNYMTFAG